MDLQKLHEEYADEGLVVLGINTADDLEISNAFIEEKKVTFLNILDTRMEASIELTKFETLEGMSAVPVTYLIDEEGKVADAWYGYQAGKAESALRKLGFGK